MRTLVTICAGLLWCAAPASAQVDGNPADRFERQVVTATAWGRQVEVTNPVYLWLWRPDTGSYTNSLAEATAARLTECALDVILKDTPESAIAGACGQIKPLFVAANNVDDVPFEESVKGHKEQLEQLAAFYHAMPAGAMPPAGSPLYTYAVGYPDEANVRKALDTMEGQSAFDVAFGDALRDDAKHLAAARALGKEEEIAVTPAEVERENLALKEVTGEAPPTEVVTYLLQVGKARNIVRGYLLEALKGDAIGFQDPGVRSAVIAILSEHNRTLSRQERADE